MILPITLDNLQKVVEYNSVNKSLWCHLENVPSILWISSSTKDHAKWNVSTADAQHSKACEKIQEILPQNVQDLSSVASSIGTLSKESLPSPTNRISYVSALTLHLKQTTKKFLLKHLIKPKH